MQPPGPISPDGFWMWNGTQWVPNPARPFVAPPPAAPYESAAPRAGIASILIYSNIVGIVLLSAVSVDIDLIPYSSSLLIGAASLVALVVWLGTLIPAVVFFCMWLHRVVRNMPALGAPDPRWSPARAVVYCFVPFIWFVHPLWSVLDAWRGADDSRRWIDQASRRGVRPPQLLAAWWGTWLVGNYVLNISSRLTGSVAVALDVIGGVAQMVAAVLCVMVIRKLTARQERKNQLIASGQLV